MVKPIWFVSSPAQIYSITQIQLQFIGFGMVYFDFKDIDSLSVEVNLVIVSYFTSNFQWFYPAKLRLANTLFESMCIRPAWYCHEQKGIFPVVTLSINPNLFTRWWPLMILHKDISVIIKIKQVSTLLVQRWYWRLLSITSGRINIVCVLPITNCDWNVQVLWRAIWTGTSLWYIVCKKSSFLKCNEHWDSSCKNKWAFNTV